MQRPRFWTALLLIAAMGSGACGQGMSADDAEERPTRAEPRKTESTATPSPSSERIVEWSSPGWSSFVHHSDAAVVGDVTAISDAFPLSEEIGGRQGDRDELGRYATLRVERVIYASEGIPTARDEDLKVLLLGDGTNTGPRVPAAHIERANAISGPVEAGDRVLWVLVHSSGFGEGDAILLRTSYLGNWRIEGKRAVNALPARSLPLEELVRLLREEREAEYRPGDRRGAGDPREVDEGSPD